MQNCHSRFTRLSLLCGMVVAISFSGCATGIKNSMRLSSKDSMWNPVEELRAEKEKESPPAAPATMVLTWKEDVYNDMYQGFGGRVFFYDKDNNAVEAEGELVIYGFDETNKSREGDKADKAFVFRAEEFQNHKSDSAFGVSYSVWCPWKKLGGFRKSITLVPMFVTSDQKLIKGGQTINILSGREPTPEQLSANKPYKVLGSSPAVSNADFEGAEGESSNISQVGFDETSPDVESKIKSSTINLSPNLAERVRNAAPKQKQSSAERQLKKNTAINEFRANLQAKKQAKAPISEKSGTATEQRKVYGSPGSFY